MSETEVINLLREQNERLLTILEKFAEKEINIVENSYNGASALTNLDNSEEHKEKITDSHNITKGGDTTHNGMNNSSGTSNDF